MCSDFLDADGMERMYRRTCLNVHPCVYDAYGMTVVEAAAFGASLWRAERRCERYELMRRSVDGAKDQSESRR